MASFARENLIRAIELTDKLPPNANRAFLPLIDAEMYLDDLEKHNFEVFQNKLSRINYFQLPFRLRKAAKSGKISHFDLEHYS